MALDNTQEETFSENPYTPVDFSKVRVGVKSLEDATLNLNTFKKINPHLGDKHKILRAINQLDYISQRQISDFFYRTSGIYKRLCRYLAYMYRYDWMITPYVNDENADAAKIKKEFYKVINFLDNCKLKKTFGEIALKVVVKGCYYGCVIKLGDRVSIQELPANYCRSRFFSAEGRPMVEFNMAYFDDAFGSAYERDRVLKLFPPEFRKGYNLYKQGKLQPDFSGDTSGWYLLTTSNVIKFNLNGEDSPVMMSVIPAIIDLEEAQGLDKKKLQQQLLKIIIQKMPIDKNGDLVFDVDEAQQLHNNAVRMLGKAVGIDVLTTFADTEVASMTDNSSTTAADEGMDRIKSTVFDQAGISQMQFNTDGNLALDKSVLNDEASMYNLVQQFEEFINLLLEDYNKHPKKVYYRAQILSTTIYNYKELAKMYKEQTQLGYSKMLPQIALGQSQSSILATAYFENDILDLVNVFIPPMSSNTMSADALVSLKDKENSKSQNASGGETGRPTKESQGESVSEKTIQNRESQS